MVKKATHIMRSLRLKLKSGFLKNEPAEYVFMKRYPPMSRDSAPRYHKLVAETIPYVNLYYKAVERNPLYDDEKVYGAYFQEEPQALTLAKKQYELMQTGLSEEIAYQKAVAYVDEIENVSYLELKKVFNALKQQGAKAPFMCDPAIVAEIAKWNDKMKSLSKSYEELELGDQGEIDFFVQTKVLKWKEVQRERRMKDPVFVKEFEELRKELFPKPQDVLARQLQEGREAFKAEFMEEHGLGAKLGNRSPFFAEEYIMFFTMLKAQPDLRRWRSEERSNLSRWVVDVLAFREIVENTPAHKVQLYLNQLRMRYFPMLQYPDRIDSYEIPTLEQLRQVLFENEVGYKRVMDQLYVKRYYRLPMLLFPKETLATAIISDEQRLQNALSSDQTLLQEISGAGLDEKTLPEIKEQLSHYLRNTKLGMPDYSRGHLSTSGAELGDILSDSFGAERAEGAEAEKPAGEEEELDEEYDDFAEADVTNDDPRHDPYRGALKEEMSAEEWALLVDRYVKRPVTELDLERDALFPAPFISEDSVTESELSAYKAAKLDADILVHARMGRQYEKKEGARRHRDIVSRNVRLDIATRPEFHDDDEI